MPFLRVRLPETFLRVGLAFAFLYPAIDAYIDPYAWLGYFPPFVTSLFHTVSIPMGLSDMVLLHSFGLFEVVLAVWVLFGKRVRTPAFLMAGILVTIVLFNLDPSNFSVVFRDVSIACGALALACMKTANT